MACDVWLYNDQLHALTAGTFEVIETDHWGVKVDYQTASARGAGGELGAQLVSPTPPEPVRIFVDDLAGRYSPASLGELHGGLPARLDISLYPLPGAVSSAVSSGAVQYPKAPAADAAQLPADVETLIVRQVQQGVWTEPEGGGVRQLYETTVIASLASRLTSRLAQRQDVWRHWLALLGVAVAAQVKYRTASH